MKRLVILVIALAFARTSFAFTTSEEINSILSQHRLGNANVGVYAISMPHNKILADMNKDEPLNPASCTKLITTAAALKTLGPKYRFPTNFYLKGNDLYVKGYGDPSFVIERLEVVADKLSKLKLGSINNIYVDDAYFDEGDFPGRQKKSSRSYNALTSALSLNHSAYTVEVFPSARVGKAGEVVVDAPGATVQNKSKTVAKGRNRIRITKQTTKDGEVILVTGTIPKNSEGVKQFINVNDPAIHFGRALKALLADRKVAVSGKVERGLITQDAKLFFEELSQPLSEVIKDMNKFSNNFMAEQLTKSIGAKEIGAPGSTAKGVQILTKYLTSLGDKEFNIENGSGLSYENRISAKDLLAVMADIYKNNDLKDAFIDSLSVSGQDGTLKKCNSDCLSGKLKAKTGTLNGVSALAGFVPTKDGTMLFVIMLNGNRVDFVTGRKVTQKITETLLLND